MHDRSGVPTPARARGRIAPVGLAHVVMRTRRYRQMVAWYQTVLEAETTWSSEMVAFLTWDEEHHRIAIANIPGLLPCPKFVAGVEHVAFSYASLGDLLATYRRLKGKGITPYWCVNHGGTTSMYFRDPDANLVELQIDNFTDPAELNAFLEGPAFRRNPIGVDFDPEELCSRHEAGESFEDLVRWRGVAARGPDTIPVAHLGRVHGLLARMAARRRRKESR